MKSKILLGANAPKMLTDALQTAREILGTDNLSVHPDYLFVEPVGKKSIGVEEVLPVVEKGLQRPVLAETAVAIINGFDLLTVAAQNKLLLTLEANRNLFVMGIATQGGSILDTVKSRVEIVEYRRASRKEFSDFENPGLAHAAFCGDLQLAKRRKKDYDGVIIPAARDVAGNPEKLLKTLHLLEEKDPDAVTGDRVLMGCVLQALKFSLAELGIACAQKGNVRLADTYCSLVERLDEEDSSMKKAAYPKEDFFLAIMEVIEKIRKETGGAGNGTL